MEWVFHLDWAQVTATSLLTLVLITIGRYLIDPYLGSYLKKKGENLATIEDIDRINQKLEEIRQGFLKSNAYLTEKGKNEATKEDINELTGMIESIKNQYASAYLPEEIIRRLNRRVGKVGGAATINTLISSIGIGCFCRLIFTYSFNLFLELRIVRPHCSRLSPR